MDIVKVGFFEERIAIQHNVWTRFMHGLNLSNWWTYSWWQCFIQLFTCFHSYLEYSFLFVQHTFHFLLAIVQLIFIDMQLVKHLMLCWRFFFATCGSNCVFDTCLMSWNDILSIKLLATDYSLSGLLFPFVFTSIISLVCQLCATSQGGPSSISFFQPHHALVLVKPTL